MIKDDKIDDKNWCSMKEDNKIDDKIKTDIQW